MAGVVEGEDAAEGDGVPMPCRLWGPRDWEWRGCGPSERAVRAFGVRRAEFRRLPGGAGHAWTDGRVVLKPVGFVPEHDWVCEVYAGWDDDAVRVPEPVRPVGGEGVGWSVDGWGGHLYLPGRDLELPREVAKVKQASDAFHLAIAGLPRPGFLDQRDDPWAYGDRLAWEDASPYGDTETLAVVDQLRKRLQPVAGPDQVLHGDILPNVLEGPDGQLGVIDWPPYFRPAAMANAIAATDAVTFNHAPLTLLDDWADGADWHQLLVRAVLYRLGPTAVFSAHNRLMGNLVAHLERLRPVLDALLSAS